MAPADPGWPPFQLLSASRHCRSRSSICERLPTHIEHTVHSTPLPHRHCVRPRRASAQHAALHQLIHLVPAQTLRSSPRPIHNHLTHRCCKLSLMHSTRTAVMQRDPGSSAERVSNHVLDCHICSAQVQQRSQALHAPAVNIDPSVMFEVSRKGESVPETSWWSRLITCRIQHQDTTPEYNTRIQQLVGKQCAPATLLAARHTRAATHTYHRAFQLTRGDSFVESDCDATPRPAMRVQDTSLRADDHRVLVCLARM